MATQMVVEFPDGAKIHFGREPPRGLAEVGVADTIVTVSADKFKAALGALSHLVAALEDTLGQITHRPDKVELGFGAALSGDVDLWVVSGEGKADFKVKLTWGGAHS
jgi:hypothetical protein